MYADDLVLLSPSVCDLQKMIIICVDEAKCLNLKFNAKKSCIMRFGARIYATLPEANIGW